MGISVGRACSVSMGISSSALFPKYPRTRIKDTTAKTQRMRIRLTFFILITSHSIRIFFKYNHLFSLNGVFLPISQ